MTTSTVDTIVSTVITDVGSILGTVLPKVFGFLALLVAVFWGVRFVIQKMRNAG